ncbi:LOW QUALITY PROTEIN: golgin subfamily B member 1-like [Bufo gargarizans]|uniref:LOW QUALITY PROTEIN: golgin subfamily B member 1-like n=1 Tax=Bufo gargarizans TaxID=30331 RepID=UPI001CF34DAC|nr:LOW QUALITY PROTEIN: golgin subfamily B member 1-like [Bufo gargarizans]
MWNWYSGDESQSSGTSPANQTAGTMSVADLTEQLAQTQKLVAQLKDLIREKDNELRKKDQDLKEEKESSESKISKAKLQNKAKIASLTSQLEELKKQLASSGAQVKKPESKKGSGDVDQENASANRGKILVLRKRVEELESQLALKNKELKKKEEDLEAQRLRGSELDVMLAAKEEKLAKKEAYIRDLQMSAASNAPVETTSAGPDAKITANESTQELQVLIQNLTRKVEQSEEKYSLLQEQTESLKAFLNKEKSVFQEKEAMYMENIRVYQNIILEKDKEMKLLSEKHDQELFKIAAKSDSTAELHQLLKALKQKLHEDEEVLSGKNQVIDVLQKELDNKDLQISEMAEKCRLLQSEKQNLHSKLDAEKHVMRAQLKDMMEKHETEMRSLSLRHSAAMQETKEKHKGEMQEKFQTIQQLQSQLQGLASPGDVRDTSATTTDSAVMKLQDEVKLKTEEASKSEAKFLKMKAWSKSKIRQLEEELKISETKNQELSALTVRVYALEEEKKALEMKLESVADLQSFNEQLLTKLVVYEEQQRILQADLEQVAKRADSQTSESGSMDELQNPLLEWNEMSQEMDMTPDQEREDTSVMVLRMAQIEEEREAMDSGQVELEEELSAARGQGKLRTARRKGSSGSSKIQDEFSFGSRSFEDQNLTTESGEIVEGENMGGWWPEYGSSDSGLGLRAVVQELEMERNQLQEQIMTLEERCQELEDRLQLQLRIESLQVTFDVDEETPSFPQSDNERFQTQLAQIRQQQSQEAEKNHDLVSTLNDQLKGLTNRNAFLENAIVEKEQTIVEVTGKLEKLNRVSKTLQEKEALVKELHEKLDQYEHQLEEVTRRQQASESENSALKMTNTELTEKVSAFKDRLLHYPSLYHSVYSITSKDKQPVIYQQQDSFLEKLQVDFDQTNDELDRLNTSHLEKQSQLLHDLQRSERELDALKELLEEKDKEMSSLSASLTEYSEQVTILKETIDFKEEQMSEMSNALIKMERELHHLKEAQTLDVQESITKISSLSEQLSEMESELNKAKHLNESKIKEAEELISQINENDIIIKNLRLEMQAQAVTHNNHLTECSAQIASLKEQMNASVAKVDETEMKLRKEVESLKLQTEADHSKKEKLALLLEEKSIQEQHFHNELKTAKEQYNKLVSELSKKDEEIKELSNQLSEHKDRSSTLDKELSGKQDELSSLQQNLAALAQSKEELVKHLQEKTEEFQTQIDVKTEIINKLHSETEALSVQIKDLETSLADKETSLKSVTNSVEELERKVNGLEDQYRHISNEKENLLTQLSQKESEIHTMSQTLQEIQKKFSEKEQELSDLQEAKSNLLREKEDLCKEIDFISAQSAQDTNATTARLEEKTKECLNLENLLRREQEAVLNLQSQIQSLEQDLKESRMVEQQKEEALKVRTSDYDGTCEQLKQKEAKNKALQKQVEKLSQIVKGKKKVLEDKEALLTTQSAQIEEMKRNLDKLHGEEQALTEVNLKVTENLEKLNSALSKLQQDYDNIVEENTKMREKVDVGSKEIERLTHERESFVLSISNFETRRDALQSQVMQSQSVVDSLNQQLNMLMTEKEKLNSDIELLKTTLSNKSEEVGLLSSHSSQQGHTIMSLKDQIDLLQVEKRDLLRNVEEKEALLLQKEELIQQTEKKLEGEGYYLQTISTLQNELQSSVSDCTQQQQRIEEQEQKLQKLHQQVQLLNNKNEEAELLKTQLAEHVVIISDLYSQLKNLKDNVEELNGALAKKDECLKEKVDCYANLKAQLSELQDSLDEQRRTIETLQHENAQYKTAVSEKDLTLKNSLLEVEELKGKCQSKDEQCNVLIKQVTTLEETTTKQLSDINKLTASLEDKETLHCRKEESLNVELEQKRNLNSDLQKTVDELSNKVKDLEQARFEKENTVQNLQEKYASLYEQNQELAESNRHKEAEISKLLTSASEKDAKLQMMESNVLAFASEVNLLRKELDKGSSNVKNISETLKLKDDIISQHQKAEEVLRNDLQSIKLESKEISTQLQALTGEREENRALIETLQDRCTSQNLYIENLKQDVDNLRLLQDQHTSALDKQQISQQLESAVQEKLHLEKIVQTLQVDRDTSLVTLQNELIHRNAVIENLEHRVQEANSRISLDAESLNVLKAGNIDLQKQVSAQAEENYALKVHIENLKINLSELQQQSEKEVAHVNEENGKLREQNESLGNDVKVKQEALQSLLKDFQFVDNQLCALCDENVSECAEFDQQYGYRSKLEKLSSMLCTAMDYKSKVAELKEVLQGKEREVAQKTQSVCLFEKERDLLLNELQKVKEQKLDNESLMEELKTAKDTSSHDQGMLQEKENVIIELNSHISVLQEEIKLSKEDLQKTHTLLSEERTKIIELIEDVNKKDSLARELNVQLGQQKELIATLSGQIKDKDASLMQVMDSMSSKMAKVSDVKNSLSLELNSLQSEKSSCHLQISELSEKLEACEKKLQLSEQILADKEIYLSKLTSEKDLQSEKFCKERENLKRKLQAALVIRKDLMQKIEKLELSKQDEVREEQLKNSELGRTVEDLNGKLESIRMENKDLQSYVKIAKQELLEKDTKISNLCSALTEKEQHLVQLQDNIAELQQSFSEKDNTCQEYLRIFQEKEQNLQQTKNALKDKLKGLEEENIHLLENLENLKICLENIQGQTSFSMLPLESSNVDLESTSAEASFSHAENTIVHNNVHASLLCSQGSSGSKEKHGGLLQSLSKSIKEFELLQKAHLDLKHSYDAQCTECEQHKDQVHKLQEQVQAQQELLFQKESDLTNKELEVEDHKKQIEDISHQLQELKEHEKFSKELTTSNQEKDAALLRVNSEHGQLLSEIELLKAETQKLSNDIQKYQEQMHSLESVVASKSVQLEHCENEITLLQKEVEVARMKIENNQATIQHLTNERDSYFETCQVSQSEVSKLKHNLEQKVIELLEKEKEIAASKDTLQLNLKSYEEDMERMQSQLKQYEKESDNLKDDYKQIKRELEESMSKLEKAETELSDFRAKLRDSKKDEILMVQSSTQPLHSHGLNQEVPETKPAFDSLQGESCDRPLTCKPCFKKQTIIEDLEKQIMSSNKVIEQLHQDHEKKVSEESSSKEQLQRKLQAALVSRKDLLKENKMLKQNIESLTLETEELKRSVTEIRENQLAEISLLTEKNNDLLSEKERLLLVNENLSAACESLKSTMESIVQEKEAFSFQLNSLKDSQTVELTGWKAKHGELNKEYESLLQAYENISDEIDKMRHVIEITKKEKNDVLLKHYDIQAENQDLVKQIEHSVAEMDRLRTTLESKEIEIQKFKLETEKLMDTVKKESLSDEVSNENRKLIEENRHLREVCENLKTTLDSKEKENNSISVIKRALDKLQMDMSMYRSNVEVKISNLSLENETLSRTVTELETKVQETEQSLEKNEIERLNILEKLNSSDQQLQQEKTIVLKLEADVSSMELDRMNLNEKVKILEDDKALLLEEIENIQEQFCKVKNEREQLETELLRVGKNNSLLSDKFKSLQAQTHILSQQVEFLRAEKNTIVREKEEHQLHVLRDLEERIKYAQNDSRGTKTKSKELQELLKEKQQEINQLHRDSIRFQELILDLDGAVKESNSQNENLKKELDHTSALLSQARNDIFILKKELADLKCKNRVEKNHLLSSNNLVNEESNRKFSSRVNERNGIEENEPIYHSKEVALQNMSSEKEVSEHPTVVEFKALKDIITENEQEIQQLKLESEKVRIDIQKQVTMSQHMKQIIDNKDKEISVLISSKDGEISSYLEQIQSEYRKQAENYEHRLSSVEAEKAKVNLEYERVEKKYQSLKLKYEKAVSDKALISGEIEAFRKSMSSLQTDRDQLSSELQTIHQRNERVLSEKDNIITSAVNENGSLKEELRNALNKMDDLNAENAMLGAQLIRYREDLNQVLSLKDEQLKELLKQKLELIKNLEQQKCDLEKHCREIQSINEALQNSGKAVALENQKLMSKVKDQEDLIAAINKEKILYESRKRKYKDVQAKTDEDLISFDQNDGELGSQNNSAEESAEEAYWGLFLENKQLKSENESFGKAMGALQNNRDSLIDDFKELQWRYASELKAEKIRGDDLDRQIDGFKSQIYGILKHNTLLNEHLTMEDQITVDQLIAAVDSLCTSLTNKSLEVTGLSSECAAYAQQIDAFSKAMASLQHDRERLFQMLKEGTAVEKAKEEGASDKEVITEREPSMNFSQPDRLTQVTELINSSASESLKLRQRIQELEKLLLEAKSVQDKLEKEITGYQYELSELRSEKNVLVAESQALRHQLSIIITEKERQIGVPAENPGNCKAEWREGKGVERMALVGSPVAAEKGNLAFEDKEQTKPEMQRYLHEIRQRDLIIQQLNTKAMESAEMNAVLSTQLKTVSHGLKDTQLRYTELQNQYYKLQRDLQVTSQTDILTEVPPGAPQERANVLVEMDNAELADLRRRLAEAELRHDATQQELSVVSDRLAEEKAQREAAEEALHLTEQQNKRLEAKSSSRDYEFSLQMDSDDEREALIIDPTQNLAVRTIKSCNVAVRRWLHGRSLYCSKLLTSKSKSRYLLFAYLLGLHVLILMCLTGAL